MGVPCSQCGRSAPTPRTLVTRAVITSALVGTTLLSINQGDVLLSGRFPPSLWWRIPMTYAVPFLVSLHAAFLASRR